MRRVWGALGSILLLVLLVALLSAAPASAQPWQPGPAKYGARKDANVRVTMPDGTSLRANVYYPTDPATGQDAPGPFPVIMVMTPYGRDTVGAASGQEGGAEAATKAGPIPYMISRGYIDVVAEVRGTGDSEGSFNLLDPIQGQDGANLVRWAAQLPHSNGRVGTYGPSYMGLDQYMTANAIGPNSPLKALFPIVAGNDTYRDVVFQGGLLDAEFDLAVITTIFGPLELVNPAAENPTDVGDLLKVESQHAPALLTYNLSQILNIASGGDQAYDEDYWQTRAPRNMLDRIVHNGIPAFMVDGWFDLYQRGAMLNYSGFQNAYFGRPVGAPMRPSQPVTGRYQLLQGPWYHLDAGFGFDVYKVELAWFDRWLKDQPTGIDQTSHPLHLYALGGNRWVDTARYPLTEAQAHTYYLSGGPSGSGAPSQNDGRLATARPTGSSGADQVLFTGTSSPCNFGTEQWSFGALTLAAEEGQLPPNPCTQDDRSIQTGPGALTYTAPPLSQTTLLAGPIDATIYATSTRPDVELVATIEDVAPNGASKPLTTGALLGSFRELDHALTWYAPDGRPLSPYHPYTRASVTPVPTGEVTRFDIEVFPTLAELAAGHRLRLTLATGDSPHLVPIPAQAANLAGGVYQVQRTAGAASYLEVPTASPGAFTGTTLLKSSARAAAPRLRLRASCRARRLRVSIGGADRGLVRRVDYRLAGRRAAGSTKSPFGRTMRVGARVRRVRLGAAAKLRDGRRATLSQRVRCTA